MSATRTYMPKVAADYEREMKGIKKVADTGGISKEAGMRAFANTVFNPGGSLNMDGWRKIGQQFVGPILIRLKYEGVTRDIILERPLPQGKAPFFPVKKDIGKAYVVAPGMGEVRIHRVEGVLVEVPLVRIASRPMVSKHDIMRMDFDLVGMVKEDATLQILEEEDKRLVTLLDQAVTSHEAANPLDDHRVENTGNWAQSSLHSAFKLIARKRLRAATFLCEAGDYYDVMDWTTENIGWKAKEELTATGAMPVYGDVNIKPCVNVVAGTGYVMPEAKYVGFMPVAWGLESTPLDHPQDGEVGWVFDEEVGFMIANANGIIRLTK